MHVKITYLNSRHPDIQHGCTGIHICMHYTYVCTGHSFFIAAPPLRIWDTQISNMGVQKYIYAREKYMSDFEIPWYLMWVYKNIHSNAYIQIHTQIYMYIYLCRPWEFETPRYLVFGGGECKVTTTLVFSFLHTACKCAVCSLLTCASTFSFFIFRAHFHTYAWTPKDKY